MNFSLDDVAELFGKASARKLCAGEVYIHRHEENKAGLYRERYHQGLYF